MERRKLERLGGSLSEFEKRFRERRRGNSLTLWVGKVIWVEKGSDFCKCWQLVMACLPQESVVSPLFACTVTGEALQCDRRGAESEIFLMAREAFDEGKRDTVV